MKYLVGVDGGGSGCRAALADSGGNILGRGECGSANIMTDFDGARSNIMKAVELAFHDAGVDVSEIPDAAAVLGLAGANGQDYARFIEAELPFRKIRIETDADTALQGAIGHGDGTVAIIGTGSVYVSRQNGKTRTVGGWGFNVGDLGSGARLGSSLLQEVLLAYDHVKEGSPLTQEVLASFDGDPVKLSDFAHFAQPGDFARFAPMVFEYAAEGDFVARLIRDKAVDDVEAELAAILPEGASVFCLLGGLGHRYAPLLKPQFREIIVDPKGDALSGAVSLGIDLFGKGRSDE